MLELGNKEDALSQYKKAYSQTDNELTTPVYKLKAGNLLESLNKPEEALALYEEIKKDYPTTSEGTNIDKYIARVKSSIK
jgi:TolA-binding protein